MAALSTKDPLWPQVRIKCRCTVSSKSCLRNFKHGRQKTLIEEISRSRPRRSKMGSTVVTTLSIRASKTLERQQSIILSPNTKRNEAWNSVIRPVITSSTIRATSRTARRLWLPQQPYRAAQNSIWADHSSARIIRNREETRWASYVAKTPKNQPTQLGKRNMRKLAAMALFHQSQVIGIVLLRCQRCPRIRKRSSRKTWFRNRNNLWTPKMVSRISIKRQISSMQPTSKICLAQSPIRRSEPGAWWPQLP